MQSDNSDKKSSNKIKKIKISKIFVNYQISVQSSRFLSTHCKNTSIIATILTFWVKSFIYEKKT